MTKQTDYAIVAMTQLASNAPESRQNARDLASETHLPAPMVSKILKALARAGLLESHRGAKGGYRLARRPEEIGVVEIIEAMEGPIAFTECCGSVADNCAHESSCPVVGHWQRITQVVWQALSGIRLADMARPQPRKHLPVIGQNPPKPLEAGPARIGASLASGAADADETGGLPV